MTYSQVLEAARRLEPFDKWSLIDALLRELRPYVLSPDRATPRLTTRERLEIARQLHGLIRPSHGRIPSDDEVRDIIAEERMRKYANR
jgi:hypothetical protein